LETLKSGAKVRFATAECQSFTAARKDEVNKDMMKTISVLKRGLVLTVALSPIVNVWGDSFQYDNGIHPAVAVNEAHQIIEVHQATDGVGPLWYRVGTTDFTARQIQWGDSFQYDNGIHPAVASTTRLDSEGVVEVHQATDGVGPLWYRVGQVDVTARQIQWGDSFQYDNGIHPAVAFQGELVVEVHQATDGVGPLWYRVGQVDVTARRIQWGDSFQYDNGIHPAVAMPLGNLGTPQETAVIEVHQATDGVGPLWYRPGLITNPSMITNAWIQWQDSVQYDNGINPAISWGFPTVMEVHQATDGVGPLWYRTASTITVPGGFAVQWSDSSQYDQGVNPAITAGGGFEQIEVHQATGGVGPLWYHLFFFNKP
jgi:hypothetical protein